MSRLEAAELIVVVSRLGVPSGYQFVILIYGGFFET